MKSFFIQLQFIVTLMVLVPCLYIAFKGDDVLLTELCKALSLVASINLIRLTQTKYSTLKK